ncbi:MAG: Holliday junction resolvase RuvX [Parabacteroides sp.]|nr:Holliday junction resolvase RuvX [Parabacteroides sp.]
MGRIVGIDYGRKRTGIAVTDTLQIIANGLTTVASGEVVKFLADYAGREPVELFVVGLPKQMNNEPSENMKYVQAFVTHLQRTIPSVPVEFYDERFTSVMAHQTMREGGLKKKKRQDKALVDEISATIILQAYLESKKYQL